MSNGRSPNISSIAIFIYPFVVYPFNTFKPKTTNKYIFKTLSIKK